MTALCVLVTFAFIFTSVVADSLVDKLSNLDANLSTSAENLTDYAEILERRLVNCTAERGYDVKERLEQETIETSLKCLAKHFNKDTLDEEVDEAKKTGTLDEVFKKYCAKQNDAKGCIRPIIDEGSVCLTEKENATVEIAWQALGAGLDFVCHNGGDHLAIFLGEEGQECLSAQSGQLDTCFKNLGLNRTVDTFVLDLHTCRIIQQVRSCVVDKLKKCRNSTPSNIIDSLLRAMLKVTPCDEDIMKASTSRPESDSPLEPPGGSAPRFISHTLFVFAPIFLTQLLRL